jgi:hypothetical protein
VDALKLLKRDGNKEASMRTTAAQWSLVLLCFSMAGAMGGGLHEHMVLTPL